MLFLFCIFSNSVCASQDLPWQSFNNTVHGRLVATTALGDMSPDQLLIGHPSFSITTGYLDNWSAAQDLGAYAVEAVATEDLINTVNFARHHDARLLVKATGHNALGQWAVPRSLMAWTHRMQDLHWHDELHVCGQVHKDVFTADAGVQFWKIYNECKSRNRFAVFGDCASVGHVGFTLGGGWGFFSKQYGSASTNVIRAEIVLPEGKLVTATPCNEYKDLFRAVRGGGPGLGIIKSFTYRTYSMPRWFGTIQNHASLSNADTKAVIEEYLLVLGELAKLKQNFSGGEFKLQSASKWTKNFGTFIDIDERRCNLVFKKMQRRHNLKYHRLTCIQGDDIYNLTNDEIVQNIPGSPPGSWMPKWENDLAKKVTIDSQSRYFFNDAIADPVKRKDFAEFLAKVLSLDIFAKYNPSLLLYSSFGLRGTNPSTLKLFRETSTNEEVGQSDGLIWLFWQEDSAEQPPEVREGVKAITKLFETYFAEDTPSYLNLASYNETNWPQRFWGHQYDFLKQVKRKYDKAELFRCHHCISTDTEEKKILLHHPRIREQKPVYP